MRICSVDGCNKKHRTGGLCDMHRQRVKNTGTTDPGKKSHAPLIDRFWRKVEKSPDDGGCWVWTGGKVRNGYGRIQEGGKDSKWISAHRYSYEIHFGTIGTGLIVRHKCDNPSCVNPAHLESGTFKDNTADMDSRGRRRTVAPTGEGNGKSMLTKDDVLYIRANPEVSHAEMARKLGVSPNTVRGVRIGRTWKEA